MPMNREEVLELMKRLRNMRHGNRLQTNRMMLKWFDGPLKEVLLDLGEDETLMEKLFANPLCEGFTTAMCTTSAALGVSERATAMLMIAMRDYFKAMLDRTNEIGTSVKECGLTPEEIRDAMGGGDMESLSRRLFGLDDCDEDGFKNF